MRANQKYRFLFLITYFMILIFVHAALFSSFFPDPTEDTSVWFYSGLLALLLGDLLLEPYFTSPRDAISNSVAALAQLFSFSIGIVWSWLVAVAVAMISLVAGALAIWLGQYRRKTPQRIARIATWIAATLGKSRVLFTVIFLVAVFSYHKTFDEAFWLLVLWIVIFAARPFERTYDFIVRTMNLLADDGQAGEIGILIGRRQPGILTIQVTNISDASDCELVCVLDDQDKCELAIITDRYYLAGINWMRALAIPGKIPKKEIGVSSGGPESVIACTSDCIPEERLKNLLESDIYRNRNQLLGIVVENSNLHTVFVELLDEDVCLSEGQLLTINVQGRDTLYQIIDAQALSELLQEKDRHGYLRLKARKLGTWNREDRIFEQTEWMPGIYSPVFLANQTDAKFDGRFVGCIPKTDFGIEVSCSDLVTHNTAILGVLGSGKSYLAFELVERLIDDGISCIVIDITGEYAIHLKHRIKADVQQDSNTIITTSIAEHAKDVDDNQSTGGNHPDFKRAIRQAIEAFMDDTTWKVRIFNPLEFTVTYQSRGAYKGEAAFDEMSSSQITGIIAEALFEYVKETANLGQDIRTDARVCLVLEEAHSLVPEWNSVIIEGEKGATMRTARAILQGRKYGLGCLLVTQRTANVTKSILNQCNTIFALQTFDATGMEFLANYIGSDYTNVLTTLKPRTCVAYGKGLNALTPVIIELNDRNAYLKYRNELWW